MFFSHHFKNIFCKVSDEKSRTIIFILCICLFSLDTLNVFFFIFGFQKFEYDEYMNIIWGFVFPLCYLFKVFSELLESVPLTYFVILEKLLVTISTSITFVPFSLSSSVCFTIPSSFYIVGNHAAWLLCNLRFLLG